MTRRKPVQPTIGSEAVRRVGLRKSFTVLSFFLEWAIVADALGRDDFTVDDFADWWELSLSQAYRRQAVYRQCFPEFRDPLALLGAVGVEVVGRAQDQVVAELFVTPFAWAS